MANYLGLQIQSLHKGEYFTAWLAEGVKFIRTDNQTKKGQKAIQKYREKGWFILWLSPSLCIMHG